MTSSSNLILQHYIKLTEFLGKALGPDYEVALHDLTRKDRSIIAIANNYISGREVGAPLTNMALSSLRDKSYERIRTIISTITASTSTVRTSDPAPFSSRTAASSSACCASTLTTAAIGPSATIS